MTSPLPDALLLTDDPATQAKTHLQEHENGRRAKTGEADLMDSAGESDEP